MIWARVITSWQSQHRPTQTLEHRQCVCDELIWRAKRVNKCCYLQTPAHLCIWFQSVQPFESLFCLSHSVDGCCQLPLLSHQMVQTQLHLSRKQKPLDKRRLKIKSSPRQNLLAHTRKYIQVWQMDGALTSWKLCSYLSSCRYWWSFRWCFSKKPSKADSMSLSCARSLKQRDFLTISTVKSSLKYVRFQTHILATNIINNKVK